ncbi:MAG TPA: sugar phosphate nucleotidyltransferase, partial [Bacteroidota bacterium]|nr:sugar phosphate nucleotidyltransferase [Bacteroidota bacterium]
LNVGGKPIIGHILDKVIETGFTEATIVVGYLGDMIKDYVLANYKIKFDFVEQEERLGLGHAIYLSRHTFSRNPILIILGDTIFDLDLKAMIGNESSVLGVKHVDDPRRFGVAETMNGYVSRVVEKPEKPASNLAIVGLYYIREPEKLVECLREIIKSNARTKGEYQLTDALQMMIDRGNKFKTFDIQGWYDCGKPETLLSTNRYLLDRNPLLPKSNDVLVQPPVFVSPESTVMNSVIGPYATVAAGAHVENSIIRNSIISEGAKVADALLEDSIVGSNATVRGRYKRINIGDSSELEFY